MSIIRDDSIRFLETSPLFAGLSGRQRRRLVEHFSESVFPAGHRILAEGMNGMELFVVIDGEVEVTHGERVVAVLGPGEFFGEVATLDGGPHTATVRAISQARCLCLANRGLRPFLVEHPQVAVTFLHHMVRRFRSAATSGGQVAPATV
jgi:CRP-like cAMP-binding protein